MLTLEGEARDWYEWLKSSSFFSLKYLEYVFYENYKGKTISLSWGEIHYDPSKNITQHIIDNDEDLEEIHPEDLLIAIHEFNILLNIYKNIHESVEEEINQEIKDIPQDILENPNNDSSSLIYEAQEDFQPQNQSPRDKEGDYISVYDEREISPFTEEEIYQILNKKIPSAPSFK